MKFPLVMFSGGVDSTVMLDLLLEKKACHVFTVKSRNLPADLCAAEEKARISIIQHLQINPLERQGYIKNVSVIELEYHDNQVGMKFGQVPFWLLAALFAVNPDIHSSVNIGYCIGDQCCYDLHHLKKAWKHLWKICKTGKVVKLCFPLIEQYYGKTELLNHLRDRRPELIPMCHYCEWPVYDKEKSIWHVCNNCQSCLRMHGTDIHQKHMNKRKRYDKTSQGRGPESD